MICIQCGGDTRVYDSRPADNGVAIRRKRRCLRCGVVFVTEERKA